jgi:hypothetical protein
VEMLLAKDHEVIEAVPPDRSDQPLRGSVLLGRQSRNWAIPYAHRREAPNKSLAIGTIAITDLAHALNRSSSAFVLFKSTVSNAVRYDCAMPTATHASAITARTRATKAGSR